VHSSCTINGMYKILMADSLLTLHLGMNFSVNGGAYTIAASCDGEGSTIPGLKKIITWKELPYSNPKGTFSFVVMKLISHLHLAQC
jgi:hypothetical protein